MVIRDTIFNTDIETIIAELRSQLRANNIQLLGNTQDTPDNLMVSCPYHKGGQERRPSAGIRKSDGLFHCFACGEIRQLDEVIAHCFGENSIFSTFGWDWLLKNFLTISVEERKPVKLDFSRDRKCKDAEMPYVSEDELDSYRYTHPYMYKRKLNDKVIELFDIGYDKNTECITFPIRDISGNTLFVARRSVNTKFFNYPRGAEKPVYGLYELCKLSTPHYETYYNGIDEWSTYVQTPYPKEIIICESMIDALTCWVYGKPAVALNGLGNDLQFKQLNNLPVRKFILATDNDAAGMRARTRLRARIKNKLITEYILPDGKKDINDLTEEEFNTLPEVY